MNYKTVKFYSKRLILFPVVTLIAFLLNVLKIILINIASLVLPSDFARVVRTPEERFKGLDSLGYDFEENYVELPVGGGKTLPRMHYVDEGPKYATEVVLCLHGEPSWSFLYRKVVKGLAKQGYRVVAPDFIGFGKSDKYSCPDAYTHFLHCMSIRLLLDHLKLKNVTLVCQDWGGLTGLNVVKDCPDLFSRLVVMNTGLPSGEHFKIRNFHKITPFLLWRQFAALFGVHLPIKYVFKSTMKESSEKVLEAYEAPFPSSLYRAGAAQWPLLVPLMPSFLVAGEMKDTKEFLKGWNKPALIMFSDNDPITRGEIPTFQRLLPHAKQVTIGGGGHFLQEERGDQLALNINKFLRNELE